jgi:RHS repeat-associated protein
VHRGPGVAVAMSGGLAMDSMLRAARGTRSARMRRWRRHGRWALAAGLAPVLAAAQFVVPATVVAVAATAVAAVAHPAPARAASLPALVLLQNGETTAPETPVLQGAGYTVTQVTPSAWAAMSAAQFAGYAALVIGDPSSGGSCSATLPTTGTLGTTWQSAVTGHVAVLGTAPAAAGTSAANTLVTDAAGYAAAGYSSASQTGTGLYLSLNCAYKTQGTPTAVALLNGVEGIGTAGGVTVLGGLSCADAGTVNAWETGAAGTFGGFTSAQLGTSSWPSPACPVEEGFKTWPAMFTPVAYDAAADAASAFTASNGTTGEPYVLLGAPVTSSTAALAPSTGGEVLGGTTVGGGNPAAPGVSQATAGDPVDTENGDFTQSSTDFSIPTFGPSLGFSRTYDAQVAQQQTRAATPGPLGYGWTDNWATSLATGQAIPGNIYAIGGLATNNGNGGPGPQSVVNAPQAVEVDGAGNTYFADTSDNRIQEIPATTGTQWGLAMTAGDVYTIAGSPGGMAGASVTGTPAAQTLFDGPQGLAVNSSGLYVSDTNNCRVVEIAGTTGTQWGISMTAGDMYVIAGRTGQCALGNDNKPATQSDLIEPASLHLGTGSHSGDLYIADTGNNRIQEIAATGGSEWNQTMTAADVYTVAGSAAGTSGQSTNGASATSAGLTAPQGVTIDGNGNMFIADTTNCRIEMVPLNNGTFFGITMNRFDLYTVAGRNASNCTIGNDNKVATQSNLWFPTSVRSPNGNLYIADASNNRVQEVAATNHTEFGQSMTATFVYTIAGSATGTAGHSGDGGAATSALMSNPSALWLDSSGNVYVSDTGNNEIRKISTSTAAISDVAGGNGQTLATTGDGGPATTSGLLSPRGIASDPNGDIFIADSANNRIQEIAASTHTQFGIAMTAGDIYTVAGNAAGQPGNSGNGGPATSARLSDPEGLAVDSAGNLYIADSNNSQIRKVSAATANISTIAGSTIGDSGNGGPATSAKLSAPAAVAVDSTGDVFLADPGNEQVQEVPAASGTNYGIAMTAGDIYGVAGTPGVSGSTGDGGRATSAKLFGDAAVVVDAGGNVYISDTLNNRIQEVAAASHTQFGIAMTAADIYTIAGSATGTQGDSGNGGPAVSAMLGQPVQIALDAAGDIYVDDTANSAVREIAVADGTQWGQSMTAGDIYNVAGTPGSVGSSGNGGPATAAQLNGESGIGTDPAGDLFIADAGADMVQEVLATATSPVPAPPGQASSLYPAPNAITITQPGGAQVYFVPQTGGTCTAPYQTAGGYCTLPAFTGAALTYNAGNQTYTFTPPPGTMSLTYSWTGQLISETALGGDTLTITYGSPVPGSGNCPAAATSCETITGANGRTLTIGSSSSGLITSVTDPMGQRSWLYGYNSASQLISATDPMGNKTSYTYGAGTTGNPLLASDLLTITDPNGQPGGPNAGAATVNVYDSSGRVTSQTDPSGAVTTFNYCVNAQAGDCMNASTGSGSVTISGADGNTTVDSYTQGALTAETAWTGSTPSEHDNGPALTATGNAAGTLLDAWETDALGNKTSYAYDQAGNVTSITDPLSNTATMAYTPLDAASCGSDATAATQCSPSQTGPTPVAPGGVITPPSTVPPPGVSFTLYDTNGNALYDTAGVYPPGSNTPSSVATSYTLYRGNSVTLGGTNITCSATPPSAALPCAQIDANGDVTQIAYNSAGDVTSESTPDGNGSQLATMTYGYDGDGERTGATPPDGNLPGANAGNYTTVTVYNLDGQQKSVTQAGGSGATVTPRTTSYGYDANSNQTTVTDPRGYTTTSTYDADNEKVMVTDPLGNATLSCYDGIGDVAQTVPPAGVAAGNLTPASCPTSYPAGYGQRLAADATTYTFNSMGQETAQTTPAPAGQSGTQTTTTSYNADGLPVQVTGPPASNGGPNQVTVTAYNADGNVTSQTTGYGTPAASTTSYCYDPNGNQTSIVSPDGNTSGVAPCETSSPWVVSPSANPTQAAYQTTGSYNSAGQVVSATAPATTAAPGGTTTTFTYDASGDLLTSTDPNGVTTTRTYLTPGGQVASVSYSGSSAHSVSYSYDAQSTMTGMTDATGSSSYTYDPFGELTSATNGAGQTVGYSYNADGEQTGITYPLPASATWATTSTVGYGYDHADRLTSVTDFTGSQIAITPNADGLPSAQTLGSTGDTVNYTYDSAGAPSSIAIKNATSTLQSFSYSDAPDGGILSETDVPSSASSPASYTYDAQGRLTSMTPGSGPALNYGFDAAGNLTTLPTGATATYDHAGELTSAALSGTTTNYAYNADGERLTAKQGSATIASGTWNGAGQLTSYAGPAADMTSATYNGNGLRASATTGSGTQNFVWDGSRLLMDSANAYVYAGGGTPAEQVSLSAGTVSYLSTDTLGSVRGIVGPSGSLTASTSYDAWGTPLTTGGLTSSTPFGYAGGYTDPTGLIYLINRYYDPGTGQFLSVDPAIGKTGQPYGYTGGDPVNATDPNGLWQVGIPSNQDPKWGEFKFKPLVGLLLGGSAIPEYAFDFIGPLKGTKGRIPDFYQRFFGWMHELKVGRSSANNDQALSEMFRDRIMLLYPGDTCHPANNKPGGKPCGWKPIEGDTWWFRYLKGNTCQISPLEMAKQNVCPNKAMRRDILQGSPQMNIVYVYYWKDRRASNQYNRVYKKARAAIARALQSNSCPYSALDNAGLPTIKYLPANFNPFQCSNNV